MSTKSLNKLFGTKFIKTHLYEALIVLEAFASKYPEYCEFNSDDATVTFCTDDLTYKINADLNANLEHSYQGTITEYCPEVLIGSTGYDTSFEETLRKLILISKNINN